MGRSLRVFMGEEGYKVNYKSNAKSSGSTNFFVVYLIYFQMDEQSY